MYNVRMIYIGPVKFEWDEKKNAANQRKHDVSFLEARSVFLDEHSIEAVDPDHSQTEDRFILVGVSERLRVLVVSYCYRKSYSMIRVISVRKANKCEEESYWRIIR